MILDPFGKLKHSTAILALIFVTTGCPSSPPCEVDESAIVINEGSTPTVPDQVVGGCYSVSVVRAFASDAEREFILRAEAEPSTKGPDPFDESQRTSYELFYPLAVNAESLAYYTRAISAFRTGTYDPIPNRDVPLDARLSYTAEVMMTDASELRTVHLRLDYIEYTPAWFPGAYASLNFYITRDVLFDSLGNIVEVSGDGPVYAAVAN